MTPEDQDGTRIAVTRRVRGNAVEIAGRLGGAPLELTITAGPCSDGMSDVVYPYTVRRRLGADIHQGCGRP